MQDLGGVRGIVNSIDEVRALQSMYVDSKSFSHKLHGTHDYIAKPKTDGYRGIHLIYKYHNTLARNGRAQEYEGLMIEMQLRTKLQHTWATAVETVGAFLGEGFKSGRGSGEWRDFFAITSSAFATLENSPVLEQHANLTSSQIYKELARTEKKISVRSQIKGLSVAADAIQTHGAGGFYNLIILDQENKMVEIRGYKREELLLASQQLAINEKLQTEGASIDTVLVSVGRLNSLKKAYPNYFLDIRDFISKIEILVQEANKIV
jgi:putative GTP pyrophosphokinase